MSFQMDVTRALLHLMPKTFSSEQRLRRSLLPGRTDAPMPWWLRQRVTTERLEGHDCPVLRLRPARPSGIHIVYLHGGAFVYPLQPMHWWIIAALINRTGATVTVPSYALAPESTFDDSIGAIDAVVQATLADAAADTVILAGDSAGGNLAVVQAMRTRDRGGRQPSGLVLFSPWVDLATSHPAAAELEATDPILAVPGAQAAGRWWAGARPVTDPMISPVHGDLGDLPPMTVLQGGHDILQPDAEKFVTLARRTGNDITYQFAPAGFHVYVAAVTTPEAREGFDLVAQRLTTADALTR